MKAIAIVFASALTLALPSLSYADKPDWAGEGGPPSEREKERVEKMN